MPDKPLANVTLQQKTCCSPSTWGGVKGSPVPLAAAATRCSTPRVSD